jgi:hypothetical protein
MTSSNQRSLRGVSTKLGCLDVLNLYNKGQELEKIKSRSIKLMDGAINKQ